MLCVCSSIFIWKPLISLLFLIRRAIILTDWTKNRADKGYPWRFPYDFLKISNIQPLFITQVWIVLLYRNYSKMFVVWMFGFADDNKIISGIENTITEQDRKKTDGFSTHFRWSPSTLYRFGLFSKLSSSSANFPKHIWIVLIA
jgi:hypothetical protein